MELVSTLVITITLLIFGEIVPKMVAKLNPDGVALRVSVIVYVLTFVFLSCGIIVCRFTKANI